MFQRIANDPPNWDYQQLAASASDTPAAHLDAVRVSMERYQGAQIQGDRVWAAKQLTAVRHYLKAAAESLRHEAATVQKEAEERSADDPRFLAELQAAQQKFVQRMRRGEGSTREELTGLQSVGLSENDVKAANQRLLAYTEPLPAKSVRTLLIETAQLYQRSAEWAEQLAADPISTGLAGVSGAPLTLSYVVGNPHDREETIDLFIRRATVPPEWTLSVVDVGTMPDGKPETRVQEVEVGRHYRVQLPAQGRLTVSSVVVPVGVVAQNTTARWAVEGKIGAELIGGMMHEMYVPGVIADLQLPPINAAGATADATADSSAPAGKSRWVSTAAIAAGVLLVVAILITLLVRSRQTRTGS